MENLSASRRSRGSDWRSGGVRGRGGPLSVALGTDPPAGDLLPLWVLARRWGPRRPRPISGSLPGAALGDRWWPRLMRPLAVGGGAAGVAVLMGIPLVGTAYILELGRRHHAPLNAERVTAALVGGFVGWLRAHFSWCRPDPPGDSQRAAAQLVSGADHGAAHRGALRARSHRSRERRSIERKAGRLNPSSGSRLAGWPWQAPQ